MRAIRVLSNVELVGILKSTLISAGYPRNPTERQNEKTRQKAGFSGVPEILKAFYGTLNGAGTRNRTRDLLITSPTLRPMVIGKTQHGAVFAEYLGIYGFHIRLQCGHFVDAPGCTRLHIPSNLCIACNALVLYAARAGPAPGVTCTWAGLCTISRRRARRREGDK